MRVVEVTRKCGCWSDRAGGGITAAGVGVSRTGTEQSMVINMHGAKNNLKATLSMSSSVVTQKEHISHLHFKGKH